MATNKMGRGLLARVGGVIGGALMLWAGAAPLAAHAAPTAVRQNIYAVLVGTWLGPGLGDAGNCGTEYGQFTFFRNGEYAYTSNSELCGGFTNAGYYRVGRGLIVLHWTECNYPCSAGTASAGFALVGRNAFQLEDGTRTYLYYRQ